MLFRSTPKSAENLEITKLAIIEMVLSIAIYVCLGLYLGTFKYLALAVVFAPLMLFRTKESAEWGLEVYNKLKDILANTLNEYESGANTTVGLILNFTLLGLLLTASALGGIAIRITATIYWGIRRPLLTLKEAPRNWLRQSLCTDFFHPPEIVPLEALASPDRYSPFNFPSVIRLFQEEGEVVMKLLISLIFSPLIIIGYLPPLIYRVTFKATSIAYLPLIWVFQTTISSALSVKIRLERFTKGELEKARRVVSYVISAVLLGKLFFVYGWLERSRYEDKFPSNRFIESVVIPYGWPWWQITLGVEAALTFFLFIFADAALARIEPQQVWREGIVLDTLSMTSLLRASLSIVTISYFFYVALKIAAPGLVSRLFGP
jgi:hypothetical protein